MSRRAVPRSLAAVMALLALAACERRAPTPWSATEVQQIASLSLERLAPLPPDPTDALADEPRAAALGRTLFFDAQLSANGAVACVSCHRPEKFFTDGLSRARGLALARRNAPSLIAAAWSPWQFWDGRADSLWSQASGPLLDAAEMGMTPEALGRTIRARYGAEFSELFGPRAFDTARVPANVGKVIEAYVRTLRPRASRFDAYAGALERGDGQADALLDARERSGLRVFIGRGQCLRCHFGPLLTNHGFHSTGLEPLADLPFDAGRLRGIEAVLGSPFNCRGAYSDAPVRACPHLEFARRAGPELWGAFKTPGLRNVAETGPYMHDGRFATLREVLDHYNRAPRVLSRDVHSEIFPLGLSDAELDDLEAFLRSLTEVR